MTRQSLSDQSSLVNAVSECLGWNEAAYGKTWTGEDEDTRFIIGPVLERFDAINEGLREVETLLKAALTPKDGGSPLGPRTLSVGKLADVEMALHRCMQLQTPHTAPHGKKELG